MKQSENYRFALPTAEDDTLANIGVISQNFETVDRVMKKNENLGVELNRFEADIMDFVGRLNTKDADLQSQIDALGGVDVSDLQSQIDTAKTDISSLKTKDTNLQYQIDTDKADIAELKAKDKNLQSQIDTANTEIIETQESVHNLDMELGLTQSNLHKVEARMGSWDGSGNLYDMVKSAKTDISALKTKDTNLQSQINTKATRKVAIVGSDTANSAGWYKVASGTMTKWTSLSLLFAVHTPATSGKHSGILQLDLRGGTEAIEIGGTLKLGWLVRAGFDLSQVIVVVDGYDWELYYKVQSPVFFRAFFEVIQESNDVSINKAVYTLYTDSVVETTAPVATATSTDLGTVNTANKLTTARNINGIAFDGSADINITANDIASTSGPEHNLAYEVGTTITDLNAVKASIGTWSSGQTISGTISSMKESIKDIDMNADLTKSDLGAVKSRIGSWGTSKTLYDMIVDLTARIEALENSAS